MPASPSQEASPRPPEGTSWLTAADAAAHLKISLPTIRSYTQRGLIPCHHLGRAVRYDRAEIDSWMRGR